MGHVSDILCAKGAQVHVITGEASVYNAIEHMVECNAGSLIVMDGKDIIGIFTERDSLRRVTLEDRAPRTTRVSEVMTPRLLCIEPTATIHECMAIMTQERIRHLPVVDQGRLVGLISIGDLVKCLSREQEVEIRYLNEYIRGHAEA